MSLVGKLIHLTGKTPKALKRIKTYGAEGIVHAQKDCVDFSSIPGPWLLVGAACAYNQWIHLSRDSNYSVEVADE